MVRGASSASTETDGPLCVLEDLHTTVRTRTGAVRAVDGVDLVIRQGETLGLVGESGSGKTMTGMSIVRLLPPGAKIAEGTIRFGDRDLVQASAEQMREVRGGEIGVIFQDPMTSLDPTMPIGRQVAETWRRHRGGSAKDGIERAREMLDWVGIPNPKQRLDSYPHQLSGGLRQRVMIAMALVCRPRLLIADEPTTALDVTIQAQILELLRELQHELGMAILLITHDMGVVANNADRVAVMYAGRILEEASTTDLFRSPRHRYSEALLEAIPRMSADRNKRLYTIGGLPPDMSRPAAGCPFAPRCRHAQDDCRREMPPFALEGSHRFACFHPAPPGSRAGDVAPASASMVSGGGSDEVLIACENVSKEFSLGAALFGRGEARSVKAVSSVSLQLRTGETFGLVGESGCGKTTLAHLMVGLETPTTGRVLYDGRELASFKRSERRQLQRDLQLMFQDPYSSLDPRMKVGAIVAEPLLAQRIGSRSERRSRVLGLLDQVGLPASAVDRYPHEFSGGQRQRIGLARSLALNPRLIVADEPVSALDVSIRSQVLNLMKDLQAEHGLTYLVISHDLSVVRYLADRIGVMYLGKLIETGTGPDIYERAAHPYTAGLLASVPDPDETGRDPHAHVKPVKGELPSAISPPSGCPYRTRCPLAQEICAEREPLLTAVEGVHQVACHFPLQPAAPQPGAIAATSGPAPEPKRL